VQPIPKRKLKDGREIIYPMLVKVPVIKRKYQELVEGIPETKVETPFYEKGDVVLVSFSSRDLSEGTIIGLLG
jgi:CxxC motif-containing protein